LCRHVFFLSDFVVFERDDGRFVDNVLGLFASNSTPPTTNSTEDIFQCVAHLKRGQLLKHSSYNNESLVIE
jgi:hypothetical protein